MDLDAVRSAWETARIDAVAGGRLGAAGGRLGAAEGRLGATGGRLGAAGGRLYSISFYVHILTANPLLDRRSKRHTSYLQSYPVPCTYRVTVSPRAADARPLSHHWAATEPPQSRHRASAEPPLSRRAYTIFIFTTLFIKHDVVGDWPTKKILYDHHSPVPSTCIGPRRAPSSGAEYTCMAGADHYTSGSKCHDRYIWSASVRICTCLYLSVDHDRNLSWKGTDKCTGLINNIPTSKQRNNTGKNNSPSQLFTAIYNARAGSMMGFGYKRWYLSTYLLWRN